MPTLTIDLTPNSKLASAPAERPEDFIRGAFLQLFQAKEKDLIASGKLRHEAIKQAQEWAQATLYIAFPAWAGQWRGRHVGM